MLSLDLNPLMPTLWQDTVNLIASLFPLLALLVGLILGFAVVGGVIRLLRKGGEGGLF